MNLIGSFNKDVSWDSDRPGIKLVIALDDLQQWLRGRPDFKHELTRFIAENTHLHSLYWLFTLDDTHYDDVVDPKDFWLQYGCLLKSSPGQRKIEPASPHVGGWLMLDQFNESAEVGEGILEVLLCEEAENLLMALHQAGESQSTLHHLSTPSLAWAVAHLHRRLPLSQLITLRHLDLVDYRWNDLRKRMARPQLSEDRLEEFLALAARVLMDTGDFHPYVTAFVNSIARAARDRYEFQDRSLTRTALGALMEGDLIKPFMETNPRLPGETAARLRLHFEPLWEWCLAKQLRRQEGLDSGQIWKAEQELDRWFSTVDPGPLGEGILQFLLLLLDRAADSEPGRVGFASGLWQFGAISPQLPSQAVWFAAPKATRLIQKHVAKVSPRELDEPANKRRLFAYMYFLCEADESALDLPTRFMSLQEHFQAIAAARLSPYYLYLTRKLLENIKENGVILRCLPYLTGCEVMEIASELAETVFAICARNVDRKGEALLPLMCDYLASNSEEAEREYAARAKTHWERHFFREWLIFFFCDLFVTEKGVDAHQVLKTQAWYEPRCHGIGRRVMLEMEREANIALGRWYRMHEGEGQKAFESMVEDLVHSPKRREREVAFHIIRHTAVTGGERDVVVDGVFHPMLEVIFMDPQLTRTVDLYQGMFKANLHNFEELERQRKALLADSKQKTSS